MFVYNVKWNGKKIFKVVFVFLCLIILAICSFSIYRIFFQSRKCEIPSSQANTISANNYTNVLKSVHENLDTYLGYRIKFSGYVYRLYDFSQDEFVLARDMIISSDFQSVVVGFLCHSKEIAKYKEHDWIEIEGTIQKGDYHGEMPVIKVEKIKSIGAPTDACVYPPDDSYIPTSIGL